MRDSSFFLVSPSVILGYGPTSRLNDCCRSPCCSPKNQRWVVAIAPNVNVVMVLWSHSGQYVSTTLCLQVFCTGHLIVEPGAPGAWSSSIVEWRPSDRHDVLNAVKILRFASKIGCYHQDLRSSWANHSNSSTFLDYKQSEAILFRNCHLPSGNFILN